MKSMQQETGNSENNTCSPLQCAKNKTSPTPSNAASKREWVGEACEISADPRPATREFNGPAVSQTKWPETNGTPKQHKLSHGKLKSTSVLGIHRRKLGRSWSSDDMRMAFAVKCKRVVDLGHGINIASDSAAPFPSLSFLPVSPLSPSLFSFVDAKVEVSQDKSAEPGNHGAHSKECLPVVEADVVSVHPAVLEPENYKHLRVRENGFDSRPNPRMLPEPFKFVQNLWQCSEPRIQVASESSESNSSTKVVNDLSIVEGGAQDTSLPLHELLALDGSIHASSLVGFPKICDGVGKT
jgi:hypothetical protein